ncbi:Acyl-CoA-binding domain-containing protein 2 [Hypsizygus marmoreus]|uniref:Acyl-CoA-binding domain-containing protein 2 n=1 Tax=Hypsizygus marmoreus TaxID=39966 RepID=A0A369KBY7_HYPMA|nr:Acyl-CoA-binding domain-containing protein 2 [Hypsizygus marmoreus]
MSAPNPSPTFTAAAAYLSTSPSLAKVSTAIQLELYGLFKCVTVSTVPSTSRPSIFDMTGRAKWDAWSTAGKTHGSADDAEARYLEIARSLGWTEEFAEHQPIPEQELSDTDDIWDDDRHSSKAGGSSGGMGGAVSAIPPPIEETDESLHGFAVSNDLSGLSLLLEEQSEVDIDVLDEFGYTALHLACDRGHLHVVRVLLSKGANPTIKDPDGLSALDLAQIAGHEEIHEYLRSFSL